VLAPNSAAACSAIRTPLVPFARDACMAASCVRWLQTSNLLSLVIPAKAGMTSKEPSLEADFGQQSLKIREPIDVQPFAVTTSCTLPPARAPTVNNPGQRRSIGNRLRAACGRIARWARIAASRIRRVKLRRQARS
jgi:hypothetical protein